jgi:hypothetical protein
MIWIFLIPFIGLLCLFFYGLKWKNDYRLIMIFGKKGSGKSTYFCKIAFKYLQKGWYVYTNMPDLVFPKIRHFEMSNLGICTPPANTVLLIDEAGIYFDNRKWASFSDALTKWFKLQRQYKCRVFLASQGFDVDAKLRLLTDVMYLHSCVFNCISIGKRIHKDVKLTESTSEAESRIATDLKFSPFWTWTFTWIPRWAPYFKSFNPPELPPMPVKAFPDNPLFTSRIARKLKARLFLINARRFFDKCKFPSSRHRRRRRVSSY